MHAMGSFDSSLNRRLYSLANYFSLRRWLALFVRSINSLQRKIANQIFLNRASEPPVSLEGFARDLCKVVPGDLISERDGEFHRVR